MVSSSPWLDIHHGSELREDADEESESPAGSTSESTETTGADDTETEREAKTHPWESVDGTRRPGQTDAGSLSPPTDQPADD